MCSVDEAKIKEHIENQMWEEDAEGIKIVTPTNLRAGYKPRIPRVPLVAMDYQFQENLPILADNGLSYAKWLFRCQGAVILQSHPCQDAPLDELATTNEKDGNANVQSVSSASS